MSASRDRPANSGVRKTVNAQQVSTESVEIATTPARGNSRLWVRNDNPDVLVFTNDLGTETVINGGASSVATLSDVTIAGLADNDILSYDLGTGKWINEPAAGAPTLSSVLTTGNDGAGLDVINIGVLTFDTAGPRGIAIGTDLYVSTANDPSQIAIGSNAYSGAVADLLGIAIGEGATCHAGSGGSVVIGTSESHSIYCVAIGTAASATGIGSIAMGTAVITGANHGVAIGHTVICSTADSIAIGHTTTATGPSSIAIGPNSSTTSDDGIAIGSGAVCSANGQNNDNIIVGSSSTISGYGVYYATVVGSSSSVTVSYGISIGFGNAVSTGRGLCIGNSNTVSGVSVVVGSGTTVANTGCVCLGDVANSTADNQLTIALGSGNTLRTEFALDGGVGSHNVDTDRLAVEVNGVQYWVKLFQ